MHEYTAINVLIITCYREINDNLYVIFIFRCCLCYVEFCLCLCDIMQGSSALLKTGTDRELRGK